MRIPRLTDRQYLWLILGIALLLRVVAACWLQFQLDVRWERDFLIEGDAAGYWELAEKIAAGDEYVVHDPPRYALRMPGYPAVLAVSIKLFGPSMFAARLLMALIGTVCVWLVYLIGSELLNNKTGLIAAFIGAILPVFVGFSVTLLSETTFTAAMLLSLWAGQRLRRHLNTEQIAFSYLKVAQWTVFTGVAIALGVYVKPSWILAAPIVAVLLLLFTSHKLPALCAGAVIIVTMFLTLLPWGLRNQRVTGHFTFTTFWMGPSLYDGLHPEATGESDMRFFDKEQLSLKMSEYEVDQHYKQRAITFAKENPGRTAQLAVNKLWRYWKPWPNADQFNNWPAKLAVGLFFLPVIFFALIGAWRCKNNIWSLAICAGPILYFSAIHAVFIGSLRYRLPAEYPLLILTAIGIQYVFEQQTQSQTH